MLGCNGHNLIDSCFKQNFFTSNSKVLALVIRNFTESDALTVKPKMSLFYACPNLQLTFSSHDAMIGMTSQLDSKTTYSLIRSIGCEIFRNPSINETNLDTEKDNLMQDRNMDITIGYEYAFTHKIHISQFKIFCLTLMHLLYILNQGLIQFIPSVFTKKVSFKINVSDDAYSTYRK